MAKDLKGELTTRGVLAAGVAAGKDAAKRAIEDFTLTDEEKAARDAERAAEAKRRRWKWIAIAVGALILVLSIVFLIAKIWMWVLGLALLAAVGVAIYYFAQRKWRAMREPVVKVSPKELPKPESERRVSEPPPVIDHDARERQLDAELAALKAKTRR